MDKDIEHLCVFLAIWTSSIEKALFSSFAHFFTGSNDLLAVHMSYREDKRVNKF
jgi:hypothetical protein